MTGAARTQGITSHLLHMGTLSPRLEYPDVCEKKSFQTKWSYFQRNFLPSWLKYLKLIVFPAEIYIQTNWGQRQVFQARMSNCIPQYSVWCDYLSLPEIPTSGTIVLNWQVIHQEVSCEFSKPRGWSTYFETVKCNLNPQTDYHLTIASDDPVCLGLDCHLFLIKTSDYFANILAQKLQIIIKSATLFHDLFDIERI